MAEDIPKLLPVLIDKIIRPILMRLQKEANQAIDLKVVVVEKNQILASEDVQPTESSSYGGLVASGELRVSFKDSARFNAQAILNGFSLGTGFSGFRLRGKIRMDDHHPAVRLSERTNTYNVYEWNEDLQVS
jgi:hypothetical protein